MRSRQILLIVSAILISGCSSSMYPPLVSIQPVSPAQPASPSELDYVLHQAYWLQTQYATGYRESAELQDFSQIPLIGAAALAALILLDNDANPHDATRVGVAAGTYSAIRGQLISPGLTDAYIAGHGALTCVLAEGSLFAGTAARDRNLALEAKLQDIADAIADLLQERFTEPTNTGTQAEALRLARTLADQAITAARTAETAALVQLGAFQGATPVFRNAVASISVRVASKGRVRPAIDFAALRDNLASPKSPSTNELQADPPPNDVASVIGRILTKTNGLIAETARLTAATPTYTQSLTRVAGCPDQIR